MRDIKFRVWDLATKSWVENFTVYQYGNVASDGVWIANKERIVMQFTGLHDKNGKEIYEGDIVEFDYGLDVGIGRARMQYVDNGFWLRGRDENFMPSENFREVIGNIWEHKHLLDNK